MVGLLALVIEASGPDALCFLVRLSLVGQQEGASLLGRFVGFFFGGAGWKHRWPYTGWKHRAPGSIRAFGSAGALRGDGGMRLGGPLWCVVGE